MRPFKLTDLDAISRIPDSQGGAWLVDAEGSIEFLRRNAHNDEIVIYASTKGVLIHGVLALKRRLTPDKISELTAVRLALRNI